MHTHQSTKGACAALNAPVLPDYLHMQTYTDLRVYGFFFFFSLLKKTKHKAQLAAEYA